MPDEIDQVISRINSLANPEVAKFRREKFGLHTDQLLGISIKDLKVLAKPNVGNDKMAIRLFDSGIYEARILCSLIFTPANLTKELMEYWTSYFNTWEICDSFCMHQYARGPYALQKAYEWCVKEPEFKKRAGFVIMASYGFSHKYDANSVFERMIPFLLEGAADDRNFVKKAVSWGFRSIGKRNRDLRSLCIKHMETLMKSESLSGQWVAKDVLKELLSDKANIQDYPRSIYRP